MINVPKISFTKMHVLGNDFLLIEEKIINDIKDIHGFVVLIANRVTGVGCDQLIFYGGVNDKEVTMKVYNRDGSQALTCGNAAICLARIIYDLYGSKNIRIETEYGLIKSEYFSKYEIKVNLGVPKFFTEKISQINVLYDFLNSFKISPKDVLCVNMPNPHLVIFVQLSHEDQKNIGSHLEQASIFRDGINVNFAYIKDRNIYLTVWERGAGFTMSCGSGACATFATAMRLGFVEDYANIIFQLGKVKMKLENQHEISMMGACSYVAKGEYFYEK